MNRILFLLFSLVTVSCITWVTEQGGRLTYNRNADGDQIPDFSTVGYRGGNVPLPNVPVKKTITADGGGDDTARIQKAIDELQASLGNGERGALLLKKGTYQVAGALKVTKNGVVIRGEGNGPDGTVIIATGKAQRDLFTFAGSKVSYKESGQRRVVSRRVPVGATTIPLSSAAGLKAGDDVILGVNYNQKWISFLKMDKIPPRKDGGKVTQWSPFTVEYERKVVSVTGTSVVLDAPTVTAIDPQYGGGYVVGYSLVRPRLQEVGIENLRMDSQFQKGKEESDENHATNAVVFNAVENAWAADLYCTHFINSCVFLSGSSKYATIQDSSNIDPVSIVTGGRRYSFSIGDASYILFQRLRTRNGRHDYVTGARVAGPNVFFAGVTTSARSDIGPHHRWATGTLYDNIQSDGQINAENRLNAGSGHGYAGNVQVFWNCQSKTSSVCSPPTGINWNIGYIGTVETPDHCPLTVQLDSKGKKDPIKSLYLAQMTARHGAAKTNANLAKRTY